MQNTLIASAEAPTTITIEEFNAYIDSFIEFWTPTAPPALEEDEPFDDGSIPAPLEVVERVAAEMELVLALGESDVKELNALGRTIRTLSGTIEAEKSGALMMGRLQRLTLWRQLRAARKRLSELWRNIEFELSLDRDDVFAY
jgi:hypothetical protein